VNEVETKYPSNCKPNKFLEGGLQLVLRIFNRTSKIFGPIVSIRFRIVESDNLSLFPTPLPIIGTKAVSEVNEDSYWNSYQGGISVRNYGVQVAVKLSLTISN
jgi:hypothetical protein